MIRLGLVLLCSFAACRSVPLYRAPLGGSPQATFQAIQQDGQAGIAPEDEALWRCELGSAALGVGDEEAAFRAFTGAASIMGTLTSSSSENARAVWGQEATKTWKGDPHERCMNALYLGLLYWRKGQLDNASACFKRGLLADGYSAEGEHQVDFAALSFLLGWVSQRRGQHDNARFNFEQAAKFAPGNSWCRDPRPEERNVLIVADIGIGPEKYATGLGASVAKFQATPCPVAGVEVIVDGAAPVRSEPAADILHQATTRGERVLDGIRKGKAIFKETAGVAGTVAIAEGVRQDRGDMVAVGIGLLALSAMTQSRADTRYWSLLPAEVHVLPLRLAPGQHELTVRAVGPDGRPIAGMSRTFPVEVAASADRLYYFQAGRYGRILGLVD